MPLPDTFGSESRMLVWTIANITGAVLQHIEDGVPKLKAEATLSEVVMLAGGTRCEHPGWITFLRSEQDFKQSFQGNSFYIEVAGNGLKIAQKTSLRDLNYDDNRWVDHEFEDSAMFENGAWSDIEAARSCLYRASMLLHHADKISVFVPDEQTWF